MTEAQPQMVARDDFFFSPQGFKHVLTKIELVRRKVGATLTKDATGSTGAREYQYATLATVWEHLDKTITEVGLNITQMPTSKGLVTIVQDPDTEEYMGCVYQLATTDLTPRDHGGCVTYERRYVLVSFFGLCPVDNDGETDKDRANAKEADEKAATIRKFNLIASTIKETKEMDGLKKYWESMKVSIDALPEEAQSMLKEAYMKRRAHLLPDEAEPA